MAKRSEWVPTTCIVNGILRMEGWQNRVTGTWTSYPPPKEPPGERVAGGGE